MVVARRNMMRNSRRWVISLAMLGVVSGVVVALVFVSRNAVKRSLLSESEVAAEVVVYTSVPTPRLWRLPAKVAEPFFRQLEVQLTGHYTDGVARADRVYISLMSRDATCFAYYVASPIPIWADSQKAIANLTKAIPDKFLIPETECPDINPPEGATRHIGITD